MMARNVGGEEAPNGESGPGWFAYILLACQCLVLGSWLWLTFVIVEDQKNPLPLNAPQSRCHSSFSSGDLRLGGSKGLCRDF